ncbi:MAG: YfhO family protein, partial [Candidatus Sericytochromatia bacterium]
NLGVVFTYGIAGIGTFAFGRAIGLPAFASTVSGLIFALGGFMVLHVEHVTMIHVAALMPVMLWAVERFRQTQAPRYVLAVGLVLALQILAGHPQMVAYSTLLVGLYAAWRGASLPAGKRLAYGGHLLALGAIGVGLCALQLLPLLDLIRQSPRHAIDYQWLAISSAAPQSLPTLFFPFLYGVNAPSALVPTALWGGSSWLLGQEGFVGMVAATLTLIGALRWREAPQVRFWLPVATVGLLLALGDHTPLYRIWGMLPIVNMMPYASRHFLEFTFAVAMLAGLGLAAVEDRTHRRRSMVALAALAVSTTAALAVLAVWVPGFIARTQPYLPQIDLRSALAVTSAAIWLPPVLLILTAGAILLGLRGQGLPMRAGVLALLLVELFVYGAHQGRFSTCPEVPEQIALRSGFEVDWRHGRTLPLSRWVYPYGDNYAYLQAIQYPGVSNLDGIPSVKGYDAFVLERYHRLLGINHGGYLRDATFIREPANHVVDILAMGQLRLDPAVAAEPAWQSLEATRWSQLPSEGGMVVFKNGRALPRAWRPGAVSVVTPETVDARLTSDPSFSPRDEALVEVPLAPRTWTGGATTARTVSFNRIRLQTSGTGPGLAVVSESYDPGWRAFAEGREFPVHRVDGLVLGVEVPPGDWEIELRYEPRLWRAGLAVSAFSALTLVAWGMRLRRRRQRA